MELVKFRPKNRKEYSDFQKYYFFIGAKVHSERDSNTLEEIAFNICDVLPQYKENKILNRDVYSIAVYKDSKGYYFQNMDSMNFNLCKKREINYSELKQLIKEATEL